MHNELHQRAKKSLYLALAGIWLATAMLLLPGTTSPLVVNVTPVNMPEFGAAPLAKLPGATVLLLAEETGAAGGIMAFGSAPSALATATGSDVNPGLISAAGVTNFLAVLISAEPDGTGGAGVPAVGAAITEVATALASLFTIEPAALGGAAVHGAVTVTVITVKGVTV